MSSLSDSNKFVFLDTFFSYFTPTFDEIDIQLQKLSGVQQQKLFTLSMNHVLNITNIDDLLAILAIYKNMGVLHVFINFLHNLNKKQGGKKKTRRRMKKKRKKTKNKRGGANCYQKCEKGARSCVQMGCGSCDIPVDGGTYFIGDEDVLQAARDGNYPICLPAMEGTSSVMVIDNEDGKERKNDSQVKSGQLESYDQMKSGQSNLDEGINKMLVVNKGIRKEALESRMIMINNYHQLLNDGKINQEFYQEMMVKIVEGWEDTSDISMKVHLNMLEQIELIKQKERAAKRIFESGELLNEKIELHIRNEKAAVEPLKKAKLAAENKLNEAREAIQELMVKDWNDKKRILIEYIKIRKSKIDARSTASILASLVGAFTVGGLGWAMGETLDTVMEPISSLLGAFFIPVDGMLGIFSWLKSYFSSAPPGDDGGLQLKVKTSLMKATGGLKVAMIGTTLGVGAITAYFFKRVIMGECSFVDTPLKTAALAIPSAGVYPTVQLIKNSTAIQKQMEEYKRLNLIKAADNTILVCKDGDKFEVETKAKFNDDYEQGDSSKGQFGKKATHMRLLVQNLERATKELDDQIAQVRHLREKEQAVEDENKQARLALLDGHFESQTHVISTLLDENRGSGLRRRRNRRRPKEDERLQNTLMNEENKTSGKKRGGFRKKKKKSKKKTHKKKKNKKSKTLKKR